MTSRETEPVVTDRDRLEDERSFLERSLSDLEDERAAGDLAEPDYEELRARYEARATEVDAALAAASEGPQAPLRAARCRIWPVSSLPPMGKRFPGVVTW